MSRLAGGGCGVLVGLLFEICIVDASIFTAAASFEVCLSGCVLEGLVVVEVIGVAGWFLAGCVECV